MRTTAERLKSLELHKRGILQDLAKLPPYDPENKEEREFLSEQLDRVLEKILILKAEQEENGRVRKNNECA